jgi:hypothetical protein
MAWPKKLDLKSHTMMLDIAGGSGAHAIGALQNWPHLKATVCEMAPVGEFVSEYAGKCNLSERLGSVTGDMWKDPSYRLICTSTRRSFTIGRPNAVDSLQKKASPRCLSAADLSFTSCFLIQKRRVYFSRLSWRW